MSNIYEAPAPAVRKPRCRLQRFVRVLLDMPTTGEKVVRIEERGPRSSKLTHYYVRVIPSAWGFATSWEKWHTDGGDGTVYQTNAGGRGNVVGEDENGEPIVDDGPAACDCKGFERFGHCRHVEATRILLAAGKLTDLRS
jgi:hypothetical protein